MERQNSEYNSTLTRTGEPSSRLYYHKVCLVGELGVGKTSFLLRIRTGEFQEECDYPSSGNLIGHGLTIASDTEKFVRKTFDGKDFGICLHDPGCAYDRRRSTLPTSNFYKSAACVLMMFSVEDGYSLEYLLDAIKEAKLYTRQQPCYFALVGNKIDILADIDPLVIESKKQQLGFEKIFYISTKTGEGMDLLLNKIVEEMSKITPLDDRVQLSEGDNDTYTNDTRSTCTKNCKYN